MTDRDLIAEGRRFARHAADEQPYVGKLRDILTAALDALEAAQRPPLGYAEFAATINQQADRIAQLEALADRVRSALAGHPRCDVHPDADQVSCGWKRAVADAQRAVEAASSSQDYRVYELREVQP